MQRFHGIIAVIITHFKKDGSIDYPAMARHIDWLIDSGVHALLPLGATGEFPSLSLKEREEVAEFVVKQAAGRVPVMVGAVSQTVGSVVEIARHAESIGAQAVMVLTPPALALRQEEIYGFYKYVSEHVDIDVMVYNNPGSAAVDVLPATMARIVKLPHMTYLKESTGDMIRVTRMVDELASDITVFCGCECLAYESFVMGAQGWISVLANAAPKMCVQLYDLVVEKHDIVAGRVLYRKMLPLLREIEESGELWQVIKYAVQKKGYCNGVLRVPRQPISPAAKAAVDAVMAETDFE